MSQWEINWDINNTYKHRLNLLSLHNPSPAALSQSCWYFGLHTFSYSSSWLSISVFEVFNSKFYGQ